MPFSENIEIGYNLDDVVIKTKDLSQIKMIEECNPYYHIDGKDKLPFFIPPFKKYINTDNLVKYDSMGLNPILYPSQSLSSIMEYINKGYWVTMDDCQFENYFVNDDRSITTKVKRVFMTYPRGLSGRAFNLIQAAKKKHGNTLLIMVGDVANSETYKLLSDAGADYVIVGHGRDMFNPETEYTGISCPLATVIDECKQYQICACDPAKIVATGQEITSFGDMMKCLALGADYVMSESLFDMVYTETHNTRIHYYVVPEYPLKGMIFEEGSIPSINQIPELLKLEAPLYWSPSEKYPLEEAFVRYDINSFIKKMEESMLTTMAYCGTTTLLEFVRDAVCMVQYNTQY